MALVAHAAKGVGRGPGGDGFNKLGRSSAHVVHLHPLAARHAYQEQLVVRRAKHVSGQRAGFNAPLDGLGSQVDGDQLVALLHADVGGAAFAVNPDVARRFAGRNALGKRQVGAVPAVQVHVVEAVARNDQPLHVRRKTQLVGVQNTAHCALHSSGFGVHKQQRVTHGVGDDERLLVRRHVQVVRLFAGVKALGFFPGERVNHANAGVLRIKHKNRWGRLSGHRPKRQKQTRWCKKSIQKVHKYPNLGGVCPGRECSPRARVSPCAGGLSRQKPAPDQPRSASAIGPATGLRAGPSHRCGNGANPPPGCSPLPPCA